MTQKSDVFKAKTICPTKTNEAFCSLNDKDISKIISLVIFVCLAMWSIRNLKDHDVSYATAILRQVIKTTVSKGLLYSSGGPCGAVHNSIDNWNNNAQCLLVDAHGDRPITRPLDSAAGSANAPGLLADAYGTQPINKVVPRSCHNHSRHHNLPWEIDRLIGVWSVSCIKERSHRSLGSQAYQHLAEPKERQCDGWTDLS